MKQRPFLALWTLAVIATVAAFVLHLGLRGRTVDLGYKLGRARAEQGRLREQKRVLSLEAASYETPHRVEMVARTLLGMNPPPPERVIPLKAIAPILPLEEAEIEGDADQPLLKPLPPATGVPGVVGAPVVPGVPGGGDDVPGAGVDAPAAPGAGAPGALDPAANPVAGDVAAPGAAPVNVPAMAPLDPGAQEGSCAVKNLDPQRARWIRIRMGVLCGLLAAGLGTVVSGAYNIQIEDGQAWLDLAERQRQRRLHVQPKRGTIYDRNGAPLAESVEVPSVSVDTVEMLRGLDEKFVSAAIQRNGERLAEALHMTPEEVIDKLNRRRRFAWLKRRVADDEVAAIRALSDRSQRYPVRGLTIEGEGHRFYPNRELLGSVLGFVSPDGEGREGLELSLEHELKGHASELRGLRDRSGRLIFSDGVDDEQALAGHNVYLTIDKAIQFTAERELDAAMKTYEAIGGSVIVVDPSTGEILAMASGPGYNPNDYGVAPPENRRNRAVVDRFEPGSTMKIFTMAGGLANRAITPTAPIYCEEGNMAIDNIVIHDTHISKWLTPTQILGVSSNIGAAKIALSMGEEKLHETFRRFGFGDSTGLPFPGEAVGVLRPAKRPWVSVETAAAAFGQGISVSALQLAMGTAAIANNGRLLEPVLVKRTEDATGQPLVEAAPRVRRDAAPAHVAKLVSEMLVSVTEGEGTGVEAAIPGFRVAGKTATAQKIDPATGKYTDTHYVASFVGFVPAEKPRIVIAVVLDEPMGGAYAGGSVAAPVFRRVGEMALRYLGVMPKGTEPMKISELSQAARAGGDQATNAYQVMSEQKGGGMTAVVTPSAPLRGGEIRLPDFQGFPIREAIKSAKALGLAPQVEGTGRVTRQEPPAGTVLPKGSAVKLVLEPPA